MNALDGATTAADSGHRARRRGPLHSFFSGPLAAASRDVFPYRIVSRVNRIADYL